MMDVPVRVIRSSKRKKTISAGMKGGELIIRIPSRMSKTEEREWVEKMKSKVTGDRKRRPRSDEELMKRAQHLNKKFFQGNIDINSIVFADNQKRRHGSCNTLNGNIRISRKLMKMPFWVLDYVIVHEIAHLVHPDHSKQFWEIVNQYRFSERARGFLMAKDLEGDEIVS